MRKWNTEEKIRDSREVVNLPKKLQKLTFDRVLNPSKNKTEKKHIDNAIAFVQAYCSRFKEMFERCENLMFFGDNYSLQTDLTALVMLEAATWEMKDFSQYVDFDTLVDYCRREVMRELDEQDSEVLWDFERAPVLAVDNINPKYFFGKDNATCSAFLSFIKKRLHKDEKLTVLSINGSLTDTKSIIDARKFTTIYVPGDYVMPNLDLYHELMNKDTNGRKGKEEVQGQTGSKVRRLQLRSTN